MIYPVYDIIEYNGQPCYRFRYSRRPEENIEQDLASEEPRITGNQIYRRKKNAKHTD